MQLPRQYSTEHSTCIASKCYGNVQPIHSYRSNYTPISRIGMNNLQNARFVTMELQNFILLAHPCSLTSYSGYY